jgi:Flp pilus assembly protein protease CpaA
MEFFFLFVMVPIVIADLWQHVIPNIYLKLLFVSLCGSWITYGIPHFGTFVFTFIFSVFLMAMNFGMGDVKLLAILVLTIQPKIFVFCGLLLIFSLTHIVILILKNRKIPALIPLAPAIFSALTTYLATR